MRFFFIFSTFFRYAAQRDAGVKIGHRGARELILNEKLKDKKKLKKNKKGRKRDFTTIITQTERH